MNIVWQIVSLGGAVACLIAYRLVFTKQFTPRRYLVLNGFGSLALLAAALHDRDVGFAVLNAAWLAITLAAARKLLKGEQQ